MSKPNEYVEIDFNSYQRKIVGFLNPNTCGTPEAKVFNGALGLAGESGEVCDVLKKFVFHEHELDKEKLKLELGDVLFYIAETADGLETTLEEIARLNIDKLTKRYPKGHFDVEDSKIKRDANPGA